jgi:hypothetical protein
MDNSPSQATGGGPEATDSPDKPAIFRQILILLRLVTTIGFGFPAWKLEPDEARLSSRFHTKSYGYLDAITTLLLRRDEIVAAVENAPGSGIIMSQSAAGDTVTSTNPEVRSSCHFYLVSSPSHHLTFQPEDPDQVMVDSEFYDTQCTLPHHLRVTGITNPDQCFPHGTACNEVKVLDSTSKSLWEDLKKNPYHYLTMKPETRHATTFSAVYIHSNACSVGKNRTRGTHIPPPG